MSKTTSPPLTSRPIAPWGNSDRLDLLQTFVLIIEAGSLSAAAIQLGTTQPTVSRRLQQLEKALGCQLINRSTHQLKANEAGERCYRQAKELLDRWETFDADLRKATAEPEGLLRVQAPHAFGQALLVDALVVFMRQFPKVKIEWELRDPAPDFIAEGVDCAIFIGEVRDPSTVAIPIANIPRIPVASPTLVDPSLELRHAKDLANLPWLAVHTQYRREITLTHQASGESCRLALRPVFSSNNLYAIRSAAIHGIGVAAVSSWLVAEDLAKGHLVQLCPGWEASSLPLYLIYPYAPYQAPKLRAFVETMRSHLHTALGKTVIPHQRR